MPLDKAADAAAFEPTHAHRTLHMRGRPVPCIVEPDAAAADYAAMAKDRALGARAQGFLNKDEELGLLFGLRLSVRSGGELLDYVVYPDEAFSDALMLHDTVCIINTRMEQLLSLRVQTDQFVKARSEFAKFSSELRGG